MELYEVLTLSLSALSLGVAVSAWFTARSAAKAGKTQAQAAEDANKLTMKALNLAEDANELSKTALIQVNEVHDPRLYLHFPHNPELEQVIEPANGDHHTPEEIEQRNIYFHLQNLGQSTVYNLTGRIKIDIGIPNDELRRPSLESKWFDLPIQKISLAHGEHLSFDTRQLGRQILQYTRPNVRYFSNPYLYATPDFQWQSESGAKYQLNQPTQKVELGSLALSHAYGLNLHTGELEMPLVFMSERDDKPVNNS